MTQKTFDHLTQRLIYPATANVSQAAFDKQRLKAVEDALLLRPHYLPVQHLLPATAQAAPISEVTDDLRFDVVVTGIVTDAENRTARLYKNRETQSTINYGNQPNLKLSMDAIAGHNVATAGFAGVQDLEQPFYLSEAEYLTLEIYQETSPGAEERVTTCFNGYRTYTRAHAEAQMSPDVRRAVERAIRSRIAPEVNYDVIKVEFDGAGNAYCETPKLDEPSLILGFRSSFSDAMVSLGFSINFNFSRRPFPIWALANEANNSRGVWNRLKSPLFVPPREQLGFVLSNTINGSVFASNGTIEVLRQTV